MQIKSVKSIKIKKISIDLWPVSTRMLQANLIFKENKNVKCNQTPLSSETPQTYFDDNSAHLRRYFEGNNFLKQYHAL